MQDRHSSSNSSSSSSSSSKGKRLQQPAAAAAPSFLIPSLCSCCRLHFVPGLQCPIKCAATRREWLCSLRFSTSGSAVYCAAAGGRGKAGPRAVCSVLCREGWPQSRLDRLRVESHGRLPAPAEHSLSCCIFILNQFPIEIPSLASNRAHSLLKPLVPSQSQYEFRSPLPRQNCFPLLVSF